MTETRNEILQGDALDVLQTLASGSVHCIVTSPPYWGLRDYGLPPTDWPAVTFIPAAGLSELTIPAMSCCLGLEPEPWAFVGHIVLVMREVWRVLRDDGTAWVNLGDSYASDPTGSRKDTDSEGRGRPSKIVNGLKPKDLCAIPWRVALALQADGWWLRSDIIWAKPNPMPESVTDRPTSAHEHVFLLTKSARYFYDADAVRERVGELTRHNTEFRGESTPYKDGASFDNSASVKTYAPAGEPSLTGRNRRNVWSIASQPYAEAHFATFPTKLVEPCILAGTSARGCCPCGAPWVRVVERELVPGPRAAKTFIVDGRDFTADKNDQGSNRQKDGHKSGYRYQVDTTGWRPTCDCPPADPQPALVLDPFFGSGTVGAVAVETGRHYLGIELNEDYIELARRRIGAAQPALIAKGLE